MTDAFEFYPNVFVSEEEREQHLFALYPRYVRPDRVIVQQAEPEPQQEPPVIEEPEIAAPPIETDEPIGEPERYSALSIVYASARGPLSRH